MASIPDDGDPIAKSQGPGDRATSGGLTSPPDPQPPRSPLSSATADSTRYDHAQRRWWRSKKFWKPTVLALFAVGFGLGALALYSAPGELSTPSFATIQLKSTFPIAAIRYEVSQSKTSPSIAKITIYVQLPSNVVHTPTKAPAADLWLEAPPGIAFETCPPDVCRYDPNEREYTWFQMLDFKYEDLDNKSGEALATFFVKASSFGYVFNDTNASAAIPRVVFLGPGSVRPILYTEYKVTSASSYDWSTFQPQLTNAGGVLWDEQVTSGAAPGIVAVGINHAKEAKDSYETFIAGAFIGVAASALVAAFQQMLNANDYRTGPQNSASGQ